MGDSLLMRRRQTRSRQQIYARNNVCSCLKLTTTKFLHKIKNTDRRQPNLTVGCLDYDRVTYHLP